MSIDKQLLDGHKQPTALIILDGFGWREEQSFNAVALANTPNFDRYWQTYPHTLLTASGEAVGLPAGQMGNSEVGHLNIGAGRIVYQDLTRINLAIEDQSFYQNEVLLKTLAQVKQSNKALHIAGLLSDGGVHSHIEHTIAVLKMAKEHGLTDVYVHAFLDGRDVAPQSGIEHVKRLLKVFAELGIGRLATLQGRYYAMDRDKRWERVEKAYQALINAQGQAFSDPLEAVQASYAQNVFDEFMLPVVLTDEHGEPVASVQDGDGFIFTNFRPDRAIQLSQALTSPTFSGFERGEQRPDGLHFVCMTTYSESVVGEIAFPPVDLTMTLGEVVSRHRLNQLRIAETEKYPHVTFFFNGGREQEFAGEKRVLIKSPQVPTYDLQPEMSVFEVTEALLAELDAGQHDLIVLNMANPDMVGHSGLLEPTIRAVEAVDECLGKIVDRIVELGGTALITADHGNADQMQDANGQPHTAHTTSPVPFILTRKGIQLREDGILADLAPTVLQLLRVAQPPEMTGSSLIR